MTSRRKRSIAGRAQPRTVTARIGRVQIRAAEAEIARWQAAASREGRTLADWARGLFDAAIQELP